MYIGSTLPKVQNDLLVQNVLLVQSTKCRVPFSVSALLVQSAHLVESALFSIQFSFSAKCTFLLETENKTMHRHYKKGYRHFLNC